MTAEVFEQILRSIQLPMGKICSDGTTYLLEEDDLLALGKNMPYEKELSSFERLLVISDGDNHVVGGLLFYWKLDIQAFVFPEYRGKGYFSSIHKNGILKEYLYPKQTVSITTDFIKDNLICRSRKPITFR